MDYAISYMAEHSHSLKLTLKLQEKQSFDISTCNTFPPSIWQLILFAQRSKMK